MIKKLAIGTVQFGLNYGINNTVGQVSQSSVNEILNLAKSEGINTIDTAFAYGNSEEVLGQTNMTQGFQIISKFPTTEQDVKTTISKSLERLRIEKLYGYMLHSFSSYNENKSIWKELSDLKSEGLVKKIGCSLYNTTDLECLLNDGIELDLIQVPYNVFDRQFEAFFPSLKAKGIEIHTRSTFLQGLFFVPVENLGHYFDPIKSKLEYLRTLSEESKASIAGLCLGFSTQNEYIDKVVIGIDEIEQLKSNIKDLKSYRTIGLKSLKSLEVKDKKIIHPSEWPKR